MDKLDYIKGRFYAYHQYIIDNESELSRQSIEEEWIRILDLYERKDEKTLKALDKELTVIINHYPKEYRKVINDRIEAAVGVNAEEVERKRHQKIKTILKRGFIRNDDEYELVHSEIDELLSLPDEDPAKRDILRLDEILVNYSVK